MLMGCFFIFTMDNEHWMFIILDGIEDRGNLCISLWVLVIHCLFVWWLTELCTFFQHLVGWHKGFKIFWSEWKETDFTQWWTCIIGNIYFLVSKLPSYHFWICTGFTSHLLFLICTPFSWCIFYFNWDSPSCPNSITDIRVLYMPRMSKLTYTISALVMRHRYKFHEEAFLTHIMIHCVL